jgi:Tfp pilus assembly major pilin PilA
VLSAQRAVAANVRASGLLDLVVSFCEWIAGRLRACDAPLHCRGPFCIRVCAFLCVVSGVVNRNANAKMHDDVRPTVCDANSLWTRAQNTTKNDKKKKKKEKRKKKTQNRFTKINIKRMVSELRDNKKKKAKKLSNLVPRTKNKDVPEPIGKYKKLEYNELY